MVAAYNRCEALSEEEEIDFEEDTSEDAPTSDYAMAKDAPMEEPGYGVARKKSVAFKVVKKQSKTSKKKLKLRSALTPSTDLTSSELEIDEKPRSQPSPLYRSTLASTFSTTKSSLVPLSQLRRIPEVNFEPSLLRPDIVHSVKNRSRLTAR